MAVQNFSTMSDSGSTTNFRTWVGAISAALQAYGGLVKTTDTGQINPATVTVPGANSSAGYEIYKFADALQATSPVFIKVEYGIGGSSNIPQVWVTVGTATDGAGTLSSLANTGVSVTSRNSLSSGNAGSTTPAPCIVNGDSSSVVLGLWNGVAGLTSIFAVERNRDPDGTPNGDGVWVMWGLQGSHTQQTVLIHNQIAQPGQNNSNGTVPYLNAGTTGIKDSIMNVFPVFTGAAPKLGAPSKFLVAHFSADLSGAGTFTNTHYGSSHNWVSWSLPRSAGSMTISASGAVSYAVRSD